MKIWIVSEWNRKGIHIDGVFSTEILADGFQQEQPYRLKKRKKYKGFDIVVDEWDVDDRVVKEPSSKSDSIKKAGA